MLTLTLFNGVNAVEYLNSCGKNTGWTNGETYILNFTEIPEIYANTYCFDFDVTTNDIVFQGKGDNITNLGVRDINFLTSSNNVLQNTIYFQDLNLNNFNSLFYSFNLISVTLNNFQITNSNLNGFNYGFRLSGSNGGGSDITLVNYIEFNNVSIIDLNDSLLYNQGTTIDRKYFNNVQVIDSLIVGSSDLTLNYNQLISGWGGYSGAFTNSVTTLNINSVAGSQAINLLTTFDSTIVKGFPYVDSDDNNVGDSLLYGNMINPVISKDLFGFKFIQDFVEGEPYINTGLYKAIVPLENNLTAGSPLTLNFGSPLDLSLTDSTIFTNYLGFFLQEGISCNNFGDRNLLSENYNCLISSNGFSGFLSNPFDTLIELIGGTIIENTYFLQGQSSSNTARILASSNGNSYNDIIIRSNVFADLVGASEKGTGIIDTKPPLKLKGSEILIYDNVFLNSNLGLNIGQTFLYVESTNPSSNKVYNNNFSIPLTLPLSEIFSYKCDVDFYHNWIGATTLISQTCDNTSINLNPLIAFNHTDNKIYYFYIGNYYENNITCVDLDNNGFCDSPHLSSNFVDYYPLTTYPFDYTAHLLTAENVVDNQFINITLENIIENETINLINGAETLSFDWKQVSQFPDLICSGYIDGVNEISSLTLNPSSNTIYNFSIAGGWTEKSYTYRVECYNDFVFYSSPEYVFNIIFGAGNINETGGTGENIFNPNPDDFNLITDDVDETFNNVIGLIGTFSNSVSQVIIPIAIFLFILFVIAGVLNLAVIR